MHIIKCAESEFTSLLADPTPGAPTPNKIKRKKQYSLFAALCFLLNYSIGSGILGIPQEYYNCGYILGSVMLIFFAVITHITRMYIFEAIVKAEAITLISHKYHIRMKEMMTNAQYIKGIRSYNKIKCNLYNLSELIGIFAGKWWKLLYDIVFSISTIICLWNYCALFAESLALNVGINMSPYFVLETCDIQEPSHDSNCRLLYSIYILIFWIWITIMTLLDFNDQKFLQILAAIFRIITVCAMAIICIGLIFYSHWYYDDSKYQFKENTSDEPISIQFNNLNGLPAFKMSGITSMIAVAAYAFGNQFSLPDVINPLSVSDRSNKKNQSMLSWLSCAISTVMYILIGISISMFFGANTESPCSLLFKGFMGFKYTLNQPMWANLLSWWVMLFPAIDIASSFPLTCTSLTNTLDSIINDSRFGSNMIMERNERHIKKLIPIFLCGFATSLSLIEWDFELIVSISGAFKLLAVFGGPCILKLKLNRLLNDKSQRKRKKKHKRKECISHNFWIYTILVTVMVAFIAVFVDMMQK